MILMMNYSFKNFLFFYPKWEILLWDEHEFIKKSCKDIERENEKMRNLFYQFAKNFFLKSQLIVTYH